MEIFDISQTIREGMAVWPGDEEFALRWTMRLRDGASGNASCLKMSVHTGTHLDAPSVDEVGSKTLPAHKTLLRCGIAILEGVRLGHVAPGNYELVCLPLRLAGVDGSPVRAMLRR